LVDYNRAGTPLAEIVTKPDIKSPAQAKIFLQELQRIARQLGVSDADMEKGQLRCDANISLREVGTADLHPKTEIKNINSFRFVEQALQYEIKRQGKQWATAGPPQTQSTRGFDSTTAKTIAHRTKEAAADYRYFPEPDIPPFVFDASFLAQLVKELPELPLAKRQRLQNQYPISYQQASLLVDYPVLAGYLENTVSELDQLDNDSASLDLTDRPLLIKEATNLILRYLRELITIGNLTGPDIKISPANFAELVVLIYQGKINRGSIAPVLSEMQRTSGDPDHIIANLGLESLTDDSLRAHVEAVILAHQDVVAKVKAGKESALKFLVGQVMQRTKGQANPAQVMDLFVNLLK
jgi:aspartyl-tRNA(Asn)/glutamyl-tRNA(Gln) amidotransferase subunit B